MNKIQLYIILLVFGCTSYSIAQTPEKETEETETASTIDESEYETENDSIYPEDRSAANYQADLIDQSRANKPFTIDQDTTLINKKFVANFKKKYVEDEDFDYKEEYNKSAWQTFKEWLQQTIEDFFRQFKTNRSTDKTIWNLFEIGGYLVIVGVLYLLIRAYLQKDLQWFFRRKSKKIAIEIDDIEKNLDQVNFPTLISDTEQSENYRLIIRYYYLWLLQQLQKKGHIIWHLEKTNSDYIREIKDDKVRADFEYLSYIYNNIWYGEHSIGIEEYSKAKKSFETIIKPRNNE